MEPWKEDAKRLIYRDKKPVNSVVDYLHKRYFPDKPTHKVKETLRSFLRTTNEYAVLHHKAAGSSSSTIEYRADGSTVSTRVIELADGQEMTPEFVVKAHGLDPAKWEVVSYTNNFWNAQQKGGYKIEMYQSKLTVKPAKINGITLEDISEYFNNSKFQNLTLPEPKNYDSCGETLEIDIADLHSGLLAWREETGSDYDLKIMRDRFINCIQDIALRCNGRKFKKIIIVGLGDIIHIDNNDNKTTKGTPQQAEGRVEKIITYTFDTYITMFDLLATIAPIEYIYCAGNHDALTGFMFAFALKQAYRSCDNITFDVSPNPQKARLVGKSLIGFEHGVDGKKSGDWLVNDFRELFGQCKYAEVHTGHLHSQTTEEKGTGVIVKRLPPLCNSSAWEHLMGYRSYKALLCYVWHDELLLRESWFNYV